jgi:hypothetical protein
MSNKWKVIWYENNHKLKKSGFPGDSPRASGAIDYAKSIISRGISASDVHVVSQRKAFAPTTQMQAKQIAGTSWCPYCLKWREFRLFAIMSDGIAGPEDFRCPICTISVNDHYVRRYNTILVARSETRVPRLPKAKTVPARRR